MLAVGVIDSDFASVMILVAAFVRIILPAIHRASAGNAAHRFEREWWRRRRRYKRRDDRPRSRRTNMEWQTIGVFIFAAVAIFLVARRGGG